ncbi:hypothetical protein [Mycobacterium pseudokansasii]|uniref:Uncharacterized protein n=1 Tax=Mycobacterium pseudokansasii TaxID=2341080 RepID=A0A498R4Q3_9MYCO|nr:hypothetical protein [Mycobacterium pseudokansasii]VBA56006.1 hypothetical protein LAUMK142_05343 [Mycobacterium pseudokansasii]
MTAADDYADYVLLKEPYVAAIRAAGAVPWWFDDAATASHHKPRGTK